MIRRAAIALLAVASLGLGPESFRYSRPIQAAPGWNVLELPDDVLASTRPGLADLRVVGERGEIAYALEESLSAVAPRLPFVNVESQPRVQTTAVLDRGLDPPLASALELELAGSDSLLKPVIVEASDTGAEFREIAQGSVFRVGPRLDSMRLRFAPNARRFLRVRFDDRNSEPVQPLGARLEQATDPAPAARALDAELTRIASGGGAFDAYALRLQAPNLGAPELVFDVRDSAFVREVRVYERMLFRDELSRRLIASGRIERSATGTGNDTLGLGEVSSALLELEIERAGTSLELGAMRVLARPRRIVFEAPAGQALALCYGAEGLAAPAYDLAQALVSGRPERLSAATLGPAEDRGERSPLAPAPRGSKLDARSWSRRAPVVLPKRGRVAYLDLGGSTGAALHEVRLLDRSGRQVPYLVETEERSAERTLRLSVRREGQRTLATLGGIAPDETLLSVTLRASAPAYFERSVEIYATPTDGRGPTGRRVLDTASWRREPKDGRAELGFVLRVSGARELGVSIDDGDNPPLELSEARAQVARRRIDFLFEPGETLELLAGNPRASRPRYDLEVIARAVLESSALPATLGAVEKPKAPVTDARPAWFWWVIVGTGLVLVAVLAGVRRSPRA